MFTVTEPSSIPPCICIALANTVGVRGIYSTRGYQPQELSGLPPKVTVVVKMVNPLNIGKKFWRCPCNRVVAPKPGTTELNTACPICKGALIKKKYICDDSGKQLTKAGQQIQDDPVGKKARNKARAARRKKHKDRSL